MVHWHAFDSGIGSDTAIYSAKTLSRIETYLQNNCENANTRLAALEEKYNAHMRLKAPVTYWKEKSATHRESAKRWRWGVAGLAVVAMLLIAFGLACLTDRALKLAHEAPPSPAIYVFLGGINLALTTILFWAGRVMTRIYFSQETLASDAAERAVMAETYLALTHDGQADEADRAIVLNALFRPGPQAVGRDVEPPPFCPARPYRA